MARKKKMQRVPEILWRLFGDRARPLLRAILSLITPPQAVAEECRWCSGKRCLTCSAASGEAEAELFLLRPEDPHDYRKLLTRCFAVVEEDAPPVAGSSPLNPWCWSQRVIVERTIEMIRLEKPGLDNVLCNGYDKHLKEDQSLSCCLGQGNLHIKRSSAILESLACPAWCLLLERVGASFMYQLLGSASIFLPLACQKYSQVAGSPITKLRHRLQKRKAISHCQSPLVDELGAQKKRRVGHAKIFFNGGCVTSSSDIEHASTLAMDSQGSIVTAAASASCPTRRKDNSHALQEVPKSRKRQRPFRWQRHRRKKQVKVGVGVDVSVGELHSDGSLNSTPMEMPVLCSCCLQLQAIRKMDHGTPIQRQNMFHNMETFSSAFPKFHELTFFKPDFCGSTSLAHEIFGLPALDRNTQTSTCFHDHCCGIRSSCLYHSLIKLLKKLIRRSYYCQHLKLLDKHCPLPLSRQDASPVAVSEVDKIDESIERCSKHQVVSFLWAILRSIVPPNLLGAPSNRRTLRRNIYKFIELRRYEKFSLKQCLHKIKSSRFQFLTSLHRSDQGLQHPQGQSAETGCNEIGIMMSDLRHSILERWIYWIFSSVVVPLILSNFYVTEFEHGKQEISYYRKSAWKELTDGAVSSMQSKICRNLSEDAVRKILSKRCFGFSKLRFLPKGNGLRMLANLKASSIIPAQSSYSQKQTRKSRKKGTLHKNPSNVVRLKSVNSGLHQTLAVLKGLKLKQPERVGAFVSDYNDVYRKLCAFILSMKKGAATLPDVYLVACDVRKAYDSINQDKLLNIMKDVIITEAEYPLMESSELISTKNSGWIRDNFRLSDGDNAVFLTAGGKSSFFGSSAGSVIIDKGRPAVVKGQDILSDLNEHVKRNILKLDRKFYLQTVGIPQGSILSSLLCSFYLGHLERNVIIPFLDRALKSDAGAISCSKDDETPQRLLLRFMDDYFFLTTSKEQATWFFTRLKRGFREYNCNMNEEKFFLNFDVGNGNVVFNNNSQRVHVSEDGTLFLKWSGLLINSTTLEVQSDYSRYLSSHVRSTLTVSWQGKPGLQLKNNLFGFLRPKFHLILIDSNINSAAVVRLNIYQLFLLCAMKFHCYVRDLSYFCKFNPRIHFDMIKRSFRYMWCLKERKMLRSKYLGLDVRPVLELDRGEVEWLGLVAFVRVLKKKHSQHQQLIASLISELSKHTISQSVSTELNYAIDKSHSSVLWKLKY